MVSHVSKYMFVDNTSDKNNSALTKDESSTTSSGSNIQHIVVYPKKEMRKKPTERNKDGGEDEKISVSRANI